MGEAPLFSRGRANHRHAKPLRQRVQVDADVLALRLVHQVHADNHLFRDFQRLQHEIEVALKTGCIAHDHDGVRIAKAEKISRHLLLGGMGEQGVGARDVHEHIGVFPRFAIALRACDGFARPVARVLVHAREAVEYRALSHVWIAGDGDYAVVFRLPLQRKAAVHRPDAHRLYGKTHASLPKKFCQTPTRIPRQSSARMAITAPRMR